jgi:YgiT-type zinc finger domain-containing protein
MMRGSSPFHVDRSGCHVLLDSVPVWVCTQCGEPLFEEREVEALQGLIQAVEQGSKRIAAAS